MYRDIFICRQGEEIRTMRKKMEDNDKLVLDFR